MKIANIVVFHMNPMSIGRLLKAVNHPAFDNYLHLDKKVSIDPYLHLSQLPQTYFVTKRVPVRWAGYSQVEAFISGMDEIIKRGIKYDFVNLLSGQDYPVKPPELIYDYLSQHKERSFMICESPPSQWWNEAFRRYTNYHFIDYGFPGRYKLGMALSKLLPEREFPLSLELYGGPYASYWILSMDAALYVHRFLKNNFLHTQFFKHTWAPDEFLIHTLLMNSPFKDSIVNENFHYMDRPIGASRPKILTSNDLPKLKETHKFFARKFDPDVDSNILDLIDKEILFKENSLGV